MDKKDIIIRESFYFLTALAAVLIGMELIWPNIVLAYFNLNYLVVIWLAAGLIMLIKK